MTSPDGYEYSDEELEEIARRTAAIAEMALDVQVVVNVNFEDQGVRAGRRLAQFMNATQAG